jgi:hypothetical protein
MKKDSNAGSGCQTRLVRRPRIPNGIPAALHKTLRNGGLFGARPKFEGHYEIVGAYTHGSNITYKVKLYHSREYQSIVEVVMDSFISPNV